jgi:NADPH:quinone reductase-like Zn-dependent oxidoreductase
MHEELALPKVHAAVVTSFDAPPHYQIFEMPNPTNNEVTVDVVAAALHPRVRSGASGSHYTSSGTLPMVPGVDGVGRRPDGQLIYFVAANDVFGTMAETTAVDLRRSVELPTGVNVPEIAAALNPAMSSWVAFRRRVPLDNKQSVLVLGATGNAGTMAVQIAKLLGAGHVIAAGRDRARLEALRALGADEVVQLGDDTSESLTVAAEVDVVVDYLWGPPTQAAMRAILTQRTDRSRSLHWIQIGSVAAESIELPSAALRSANLQLLGSGQGSIGGAEYLGELPSLIAAIDAGKLAASPRVYPLAAVEETWGLPEVPGERIVFVP